MRIERTLAPTADEIERIYQGLVAYHQQWVPELTEQSFAFLVRDDDGQVVGGLTGVRFNTTVQIRLLWLDEALRHQGIGSELIARVEAEARAQRLTYIAVDTYTFQAPQFYESLGFQEIGRYPDYLVTGVDKIFYRKSLSGASSAAPYR